MLTVESGGVLLVRHEGSITRVVVPLAEGTDSPPLSGDGWTLELSAGWSFEPGPRAGDWVVVRRER
ncbi:MAG: hypothetical protein GTN62_00530 [Gemmatimonadales bacterium]|nr:hypothetical protein [Gemmatimonadales bacterium]NIN48593.1 hypothetical protein [Gemmatimonadales bacterium]NIP06057.1 hypothetical protein [Gemmatimonadales bacterium]NIQ98614.1 hypothetical protein [Gemmatimonadales bacterium]NIS63534.1 hypothetical protein [Gemmatimonadales bacterium]